MANARSLCFESAAVNRRSPSRARGAASGAPRERASMACGLGALWLHVGDLRRATDWFRRVSDEIVDEGAQRSVGHPVLSVLNTIRAERPLSSGSPHLRAPICR